jgi:hypothetical protein
MNQTNTTPIPEELAIFQALDEIDKDPAIGNFTPEQQQNLIKKLFSKEANMERLERVRKRKQVVTTELEKILEMEKQLLEIIEE